MNRPEHQQSTILIVEDDAADRHILASILSHEGYRVCEASNGTTALSQVRECQPDLLLLDIRLPDMDGYEVCQQILADPSSSDLRIIGVSALGKAEAKVKALEAGAADYVTKPFEVKEVLARVETHLSMQSVQRQLVEKNAQLEREMAERVRAEEALVQRSRDLEMINRASQAFGSSLDLDQVLSVGLEEMRRVLDVAGCSIWLADPRTGHLVCRQVVGLGYEQVRGWRLEPGQGIAGWVLARGTSEIVPDTVADERYFEDVAIQIGLGLRSLLALPLQVKDTVIGVLEAVSTETERFTPHDLAVLEPLAMSAAIAIDNARLYEQARHDLAARIRAEKALRESEERYRSVVENSQVGILIVDDSHQIAYANQELARILGCDQQQVIGTDFRQFLLERDRQRISDRYLARQQGREAISRYELTFVRADGERRCAEISAALTRDSTGEAVTIAQVLDITERKEAEREIELLARFPGENPNPVLRVARDGTLLYANEASGPLLAAWGCPVGQRLPAAWHQTILDVLRQGTADEIEFELDDRLFSLTLAPIEEVGYVNIYGLDITERRRAQEAFIAASRLEAAATLAGGIAHKVNNLMVGVLGYAELLKSELADNTEAIEMLNTISRSAENAGDLALQVLAFTRDTRHQPKPMNLNDAIDRVLQVQERLLPDDIEVSTYSDPELWDIVADSTQVSQVFLSILTNAVEAIDDGGQITISTSNRQLDGDGLPLAPGQYVCLSVEDDGCGMNAEVQAKAFEPFFTTKFPGRGLGLAAAYGIVKRHGGHIEIDSMPDRGSTVSVYLPAETASGG
jgi:PAS domain S-box-containing protein